MQFNSAEVDPQSRSSMIKKVLKSDAIDDSPSGLIDIEEMIREADKTSSSSEQTER